MPAPPAAPQKPVLSATQRATSPQRGGPPTISGTCPTASAPASPPSHTSRAPRECQTTNRHPCQRRYRGSRMPCHPSRAVPQTPPHYFWHSSHRVCTGVAAFAHIQGTQGMQDDKPAPLPTLLPCQPCATSPQRSDSLPPPLALVPQRPHPRRRVRTRPGPQGTSGDRQAPLPLFVQRQRQLPCHHGSMCPIPTSRHVHACAVAFPRPSLHHA
jgi:hypothetical protein